MNWSRAEVSGETPHHGLRSATTTRVGNKIFVFGGRGSPNQPYFHNLYIFDTGTLLVIYRDDDDRCHIWN
jgi:hypothetical protein